MRGLAVCVLSATIVCGTISSPASDRAQINWYRDFKLAENESKLLGRPLFVHVSSKWSPTCLRMERTTYVDPKVVEWFGESLLAVYVDADASPELAARLRATSLPMAVVLSANGSELLRIEGYRSADSLIVELKNRLGGVATTQSAARPKVTLTQVRLMSPSSEAQRSEIHLTAHQDQAQRDDQKQRVEPDAPRVPKAVAPPAVRFDGCCPVSMLESKNLARGVPEFSIEHEGQTIYFASAEQREKFNCDVAQYLPVLNGLCPVSFVDAGCEKPGEPQFGAVFRQRLYLFAGPDERQQFQANPKRYADCDLAHAGSCPVCEKDSGWLEPGRREFQHFVGRQLYRFDCDEHRRRFADSPASFDSRK
jgi:YHS domain-containing protein/thioredoxin-related protein